MRLIFAGTPEFAARALDALAFAGHEIALVLTQPDRPAGRGLKLKPSAVKQSAAKRRFAIAQPESLKNAAIEAQIAAINADAIVVAAYGLIIPPRILAMPRFGCINIHASLLPRWRGAAPVQRAILAGDALTGISIMQMDAGLDSGPILSRHEMPIDPDATAASLTEELATLGARAIVETLPRLERGELTAVAQDAAAASYAHKITKAEAQIDWNNDAATIARAVRAYNPFPGAATMFKHTGLKIWQAKVVDERGVAGRILVAGRDGLLVACGTQALLIGELQQAGGKRVSAAAFVAGSGIQAGMSLGDDLTVDA